MAGSLADLSVSSLTQREMLESFEQQLSALYQEKLEAAVMVRMRETIANLEAQLVELYREKEGLRSAV